MINGQHRLNAIIKSETIQPMLVVYGVEHNLNMDRPTVRTAADNLQIFSDLPRLLTNQKSVAMCNFLRRIINDESYKVKSGYGLYEFITINKEELFNFFTDVGTGYYGRGIKTKFTNAPVLSAFYLAYINHVPIELLRNMKKVLHTGEYLFPNYSNDRFLPMIRLDRSLMGNSKGSSAQGRYEYFLRTIFAIKEVEDGKDCGNNKMAKKIFYDFKYKDKKLSECYEKCVFLIQK